MITLMKMAVFNVFMTRITIRKMINDIYLESVNINAYYFILHRLNNINTFSFFLMYLSFFEFRKRNKKIAGKILL